MFCSTVIATIARPSLSRAVKSVLNQELPDAEFEIIVVNDSSRPLPRESWQCSDRVRLIETNRRERSVARNTGAAVASGKYLHFLDDDDWLLPGALESFRRLASTSEASLLYGNPLLVDRKENPIVQLDYDLGGNCFIQMIAGEFFFLGSFVVHADTFFAVGGFDPLMTANEETDLCRRIALHSDFLGTSNDVVCVAVGQEISSTDYTSLAAQSRKSREEILSQPGAFFRMRDSAHNSYWHGRIVRAYVTSLVWNVQQKRPCIASSRAASALVSIALAGRHLFSADFWRALAKPHYSLAYSRGLWRSNPAERPIAEHTR